jgi:hypothetical protein
VRPRGAPQKEALADKPGRSLIRLKTPVTGFKIF